MTKSIKETGRLSRLPLSLDVAQITAIGCIKFVVTSCHVVSCWLLTLLQSINSGQIIKMTNCWILGLILSPEVAVSFLTYGPQPQTSPHFKEEGRYETSKVMLPKISKFFFPELVVIKGALQKT